MKRSDMITVREFAELIDRPYHTVRRWVRLGTVPGVEAVIVPGRGPVYHVPRSAVAQFKKDQPRRGRPRRRKGDELKKVLGAAKAK
jgi:hypothetical protein